MESSTESTAGLRRRPMQRRSAERYERSAQRLSGVFPNFREEVFEGVHHLHTSHQAEPARVAALLLELWGVA